MRTLVVLLLFVAGSAHAATAYFVSQRTGTSVTGQMITICTYQYGGQHFDRNFPGMIMCPMSVEVS